MAVAEERETRAIVLEAADNGAKVLSRARTACLTTMPTRTTNNLTQCKATYPRVKTRTL